MDSDLEEKYDKEQKRRRRKKHRKEKDEFDEFVEVDTSDIPRPVPPIPLPPQALLPGIVSPLILPPPLPQVQTPTLVPEPVAAPTVDPLAFKLNTASDGKLQLLVLVCTVSGEIFLLYTVLPLPKAEGIY